MLIVDSSCCDVGVQDKAESRGKGYKPQIKPNQGTLNNMKNLYLSARRPAAGVGCHTALQTVLLLLSLVLFGAEAFCPISDGSSTTSTALSALQAKKTAVIAGATGYIGRAVVQESVRQGYETFALVRSADKASEYSSDFEGARVVECNVCEPETLQQTFAEITEECGGRPIDLLCSCLASRSGIKKEANEIDYQATLNCLNAGRAVNARHFVLLSAFCVKNPWLQFQQAKLKFEAALQEQTAMTWTIVRPTAFFKSVSGQLEALQSGTPFILFMNGKVKSNPIAECDLATYLVDSAKDASRKNKVINLGGPDEPLSRLQQGYMMFKATGQEPSFSFADVGIFDTIINGLQFWANVTEWEALQNAAESVRIGKYYAVEDMVTTDPNEKYGTITLQEHFNRIAAEGQEYDPYVRQFSNWIGSALKATNAFQVPRWLKKQQAQHQQSANHPTAASTPATAKTVFESE